MKLLHVSDLHIGKRVNNMPMLDDQRHILRQILDIARERQVDALLIAGDIYDKASPSAEAVTVFDSFLTQLADTGLRVLAIPGNHDSSERIAYAQQLLEAQGVCFPPVYSGEVERITLQDEHGDVDFWLLPFLKPGDVRRFFPDKEIGDDYSTALRAALGACDIDLAKRNVILSHQLVTAGGADPDRADDEIKLGGIDNVDVSVYDAFDYAALGHVHRPQRVGRDTVRYSGSPLKYSFSEARYPKSCVLLELGEKPAGAAVGECVDFELVPLTPLHDMREVHATLDELIALAADGGENADDYLHVTLSDDKPQLDAMAKVRECFPNTMSLDYDNIIQLADRPQTYAAVDPDELDTFELFEAFYKEQTNKQLSDEQKEFMARLIVGIEEQTARGEGPADANKAANDGEDIVIPDTESEEGGAR